MMPLVQPAPPPERVHQHLGDERGARRQWHGHRHIPRSSGARRLTRARAAERAQAPGPAPQDPAADAVPRRVPGQCQPARPPRLNVTPPGHRQLDEPV